MVPRNGPAGKRTELADAHSLVDMGVPVFACGLKANGDPIPPRGYQRLKPDHAHVDKWEKGMALCAVTGIVFDVIDIDPRNGGALSIKRLHRKLGDDGPVVYWEVSTASGGTHLYVRAMGIGTHPGFLPGIDLKGGMPDGSSRGFVFLPPTVRPSKAEGNEGTRVAYVPKIPLAQLNGQAPSTEALSRVVDAPPLEGRVVGSAREQASELRQECLDAKAGGQRGALLRYVHELERKGYERDDIVGLLTLLVREMPQYDKRKPWTTRHFRGLLHKPGEVVGDATEDEMGTAIAVRHGGLTAYTRGEREKTSWLMSRYIAFGDATMLDGDAGLGKSLVTLDIAARLSSGRPMPMEAEARFDAMPVLLLAPEDRVAVTAGRLEAALAGEGNVFRPDLELVETKRKDRAGTHREKRATYEGEMLAFPDCIPKLRQWIKEYDIKLVVIDPIAAFLSERTNSNNDASVRRALEPLSLLLGSTGCAAILVRHLNKNTGQAAKFRGGGSVAFGAVSRIQLLAGELTGRPGFGIGQIKNNHLARKPDEVMTYTIEDSDIVADDEGNMVPRILWGENIRMGLPELAGEKKHGPQATAQPDIEEVLKELYDAQDTWPSKEVIARLKEEGVSTDRKTVTKVREALGIRSAPVYKPGGGLDYWNWTTVPEKHGPGRRRRG